MSARASITAAARLPRWLEAELGSCPSAGSGVHFWIFRIARNLIVHMSEEEIFAALKSMVATCGRPVPDCEIISQIRNARVCPWYPKHPEAFRHGLDLPVESPLPPVQSAWPRGDLEKIHQIVVDGGGLHDLFERSPMHYDDQARTEEIIDTLFPGDPLLCVGKSQMCFATRRREIWRGQLERLPFIVPNPMSGVFGRTKVEHRLSQHTLQRTATRVYLVVEFDFCEHTRDGETLSPWAASVREWRAAGTTVADACAALHLHLALRLPLVAVVHSGSRSLHGWYLTFRRSEAELRSFMNYAVMLGADPATWLRSQFVRLPDGRRENGRRQVTYFLDPKKAVTDERRNNSDPEN
jgi:hypothetical protein